MCVIWETECDFGYTKRRRIDEDDAEQEADDEEEVAEAFLAGENVKFYQKRKMRLVFHTPFIVFLETLLLLIYLFI